MYELILSRELLKAYYLANPRVLYGQTCQHSIREISSESLESTSAYRLVDTNCVHSVHFPKFPLNYCFNHNRRFSKVLTASSCSQLQADWPPVVRQEPRTNVSKINFVYYSGKGTSATTASTTIPKGKLQTKLLPNSWLLPFNPPLHLIQESLPSSICTVIIITCYQSTIIFTFKTWAKTYVFNV